MELRIDVLFSFALIAALTVTAAPVDYATDASGRATAGSTAVVHSLIATGDALMADRRFDEARQAYSAAAEMTRTGGALPVESVRREANAYYFEADFAHAAATLEELASEAEAAGDLAAEGWALVDAIYLTELAGRNIYPGLERLDAVMERPGFPDDVRAEIETKFGFDRDFVAFAPHLPSW